MVALARNAKERVIGAGMGFLSATGLHRLIASGTSGIGVILMFHRVRPFGGEAFAPNRGLEIEADFLDKALGLLGERGYDIVTLDEALRRMATAATGQGTRPFAVLTFDDAYKDTLSQALPVLDQHQAPFTLFVATGFAERTARLWWLELEEAIRILPRISIKTGRETISLPAATDLEKSMAFKRIYWALREGSEEALLATIGELADSAGIDGKALVAANCLDVEGVKRIAASPFCTIGAHTLSHIMLAKHAPERARVEIFESRRILQEWTGQEVRHFAFPVGDPTSAGQREFTLAREAGFASAVTTRPGVIFPEHAVHLMALPRLSVNGAWQSEAAFDVLLSGAAFALWNRGRRVNVD